ncbi:MAG: sugar phosphate isomerase/epimerase [Chloroflexi bacterium]|nr:sugar phosphate isomerase/epimerase [Chloroflexota bacterium]
MQLGFNGATTMTSPYETDVRIASKAGYDALEITATKLDKYLESHSIADARKLLDAARVRAHAINSIEKINLRDANGRAQVIARTKQLCESARALACPWIVVVPGPAPDGTAWKNIRDDTVDSLRAMSEIAVSFKANLAFEFLGFPWCSVRTVAQGWEIVQTVSRANVGFVIDTCHYYSGDSTLDSIRAVDARKLAIFHINDVEAMPKEKIEDANRLFPGDGVIPLKEIIDAVRGIGFDGVASIEIFRPEYWARDPLSVAREAKEKAMRVLAL